MVGGPRVTMVVPTFNRGSLLERAVRSGLAQTRPPDEVIVIDDGSTDDTPARLERFGTDVRVIRQPNSGVAAARNAGVRATRHEWVAFLDSDDVWRPDHLERVTSAIVQTHGAADLYFDDVTRSGELAGVTEWELAGFSPVEPVDLVADGRGWVVRDRHLMLLPGSVVRRDAYLEIGGLDERLWSREDTHFFIRLGLGRPLCAVAGIGTDTTADDVSGGRLTEGRQRRRYTEVTILLWSDLLARGLPFTRDERRWVRRRLARAHRTGVVLALRRGPRWRAVPHLVGRLRYSVG